MSQYDKDEIILIVDGERVEQLQNFDPPEESYDRSFSSTRGDDPNVQMKDNDPELEGEIEVAPTSGSIPMLNDRLRSGEEVAISARYPADDAEDSDTWVRSVFTDKDRANSFDDDPESPPNQVYSFIADDVQ